MAWSSSSYLAKKFITFIPFWLDLRHTMAKNLFFKSHHVLRKFKTPPPKESSIFFCLSCEIFLPSAPWLRNLLFQLRCLLLFFFPTATYTQNTFFYLRSSFIMHYLVFNHSFSVTFFCVEKNLVYLKNQICISLSYNSINFTSALKVIAFMLASNAHRNLSIYLFGRLL